MWPPRFNTPSIMPDGDFDLSTLAPAAPCFRTSAEVLPLLEKACAARPDVARLETIGTSEEGRPIAGVMMGRGSRAVSLIAGNHADEPVGPETLRTFVLGVLAAPEKFGDLLSAFTFYVVPHTNPDGEWGNGAWIEKWPDAAAFILHQQREKPGRDLEFGFPDLRVENRAVADFLRPGAPFALHASLHGMAFAEGAMLLIERQWAGRTRALRQAFSEAAAQHGLGLHDHNREGEKGFFYIARGFTTTPEGAAMRAHFRALDEPETATLFRDSSMEFVRGLGGDPLSLVTELPLFLVPPDADARCGEAPAYERFRADLPRLRAQLARDDHGEIDGRNLQPVPLADVLAVHFKTLQAALSRVFS